MIRLEFCKNTDPRYKEMRDRHYIPNKGTHGQQCHYLVWDGDVHAGIISGASAVYGIAARDKFFGLAKGKLKEAQINGIVHNVVFRLEHTRPNLATQVLAKWRRVIAADWELLYGARVAGFETLIIEERREHMPDRLGTLYAADNWTFLGVTAGSTKQHTKGGLTASHTRATVVPKLLYCYRCKDKKKRPVPLPWFYQSSWKGENSHLQYERQKTRKQLLDRGPI